MAPIALLARAEAICKSIQHSVLLEFRQMVIINTLLLLNKLNCYNQFPIRVKLCNTYNLQFISD